MYEFVTGPLAIASLLICLVGLFIRGILYIRGLDWQLDRVSYGVNTSYGVKGAVRSILFWITPYGTRSWRFYKGFTLLVFSFHICLMASPVLLPAHNILIKQAFGFGLPTVSERFADMMAIIAVFSGCCILMRRLLFPEVRILTTAYDLLILAVVLAPFVTGIIAYHQMGNYSFWIVLHVLSGEVMLVAIPFTKLSHFLLFFMSRAQLGMDFGIKRGGMKSKGLAW